MDSPRDNFVKLRIAEKESGDASATRAAQTRVAHFRFNLPIV
jgi:hypothetical protein